MKSIFLTTGVFKTEQFPDYAKYAFSYDGYLCFSNMHPEVMFVPGVEFCWIPNEKSKYKKCSTRIKPDYIERLVLCKNGNDFEPHEKELEFMRKIDESIGET